MKLASSRKSREMAVGRHEGLLGHLVGAFPGAQRGQDGPEDRRPVPVDQHPERGIVAPPGSLDQLRIAHTLNRHSAPWPGWVIMGFLQGTRG